MLRILRLPAQLVLWLFGALGAVCAALWLAASLQVLQPFIVISGSMEPAISTGDLVISRPVDVADIEVGQVVSLPSPSQDTIVTHRVIDVVRDGGGATVTMQGDANERPDAEPYRVTDRAWAPSVVVPGVGGVAAELMRPDVWGPLLLGVGACAGLVLLTSWHAAPAGAAGAASTAGTGTGRRTDEVRSTSTRTGRHVAA